MSNGAYYKLVNGERVPMTQEEIDQLLIPREGPLGPSEAEAAASTQQEAKHGPASKTSRRR